MIPEGVSGLEVSLNHFARPDLGQARSPRGQFSWSESEGCLLHTELDDLDLPLADEDDVEDLAHRSTGWVTLHNCDISDHIEGRQLTLSWSALRGFSRDHELVMSPVHLAWRAFDESGEPLHRDELNPEAWIKSALEWSVIPISNRVYGESETLYMSPRPYLGPSERSTLDGLSRR